MLRFFSKNSKITCYFLAFTIPVIFMLIISCALNFSPFGDVAPLVADMSVQFETYVAYLKTVFFGSNDMFYTFSKTIGGDMTGFAFYYLGNPFLYLLAFLPYELIPCGMLFIVILMMALASLNFNIMLNNIYDVRWSSLIFSVSYAFIGYFTAYYNFIIFFFNVMLVPLIVLGLYEITIKEKKSFKYTVFLALSIISNYYVGYMTCIFCGLFFIYLIVVSKKIAPTDGRGNNVKKHLSVLWTFIWQTFLAVALSSVALFTVANSLTKGQKFGENYGFKFSRGINFELPDVFSNLYDISFNGNISDGLPIIYCGTIAVIFLILYFLNKEIHLKEKIASLLFILIFIFSFYAKFLNRIWHGLAETVGFPYRYSFFLSFFILFIAYKAFCLMKQGTRKYHTLVVFSLFVLYSLYLMITKSDYVGLLQIILTGAFLGMYLMGIYAICYKREYMYPIMIGFFVIMSFELLLNSHYSISRYFKNADMEKATLKYYDDYYKSLKNIYDYTVSDNKNNEFYRMDKLYRNNNNDAMHVGYNGLSHFSSTESTDVLSFMSDMGYCANNMWSYYGEDGNTSFSDSFFSLKYLISQYDETCKPYELMTVIDEKYIFKNPYVLGLAFSSTDEINDINREEYNHFTLQNAISKSITGNPYGIYRPVEVLNVKYENVEKYEKSLTRIDSEKEAYIEYELNVTSPDVVYMYFSAPYKQKTKLEVNGLSKSDYFTSYGWEIKCTGRFNENSIIPVRIYLEQDEIEIDGYEFYYESKDELKRWYDDAKTDQIKSEIITSSNIKITADVESDRNFIVCSMPYDESWHVMVDGKETETKPVMEALMSFKVSPGHHEIKMRYVPKGLIPGAIVSLISLIILITLYISERIRIKKLIKGE